MYYIINMCIVSSFSCSMRKKVFTKLGGKRDIYTRIISADMVLEGRPPSPGTINQLINQLITIICTSHITHTYIYISTTTTTTAIMFISLPGGEGYLLLC